MFFWFRLCGSYEKIYPFYKVYIRNVNVSSCGLKLFTSLSSLILKSIKFKSKKI